MTASSTTTVDRRIITLELIRKRSEHNECLVSTLEEIALHQEELEAIGPILGRTCGKTLQILLLQNNVISRMEPGDLRFMRSLRYLNLALNNVRKIEGLDNCEFLEKLDLTLNFIDVDAVEESIANLRGLKHLRELYLLGNPCHHAPNTDEQQSSSGSGQPNTCAASNEPSKGGCWTGYRQYVIAMLPQVQLLDGKEVPRSERIRARQRLPALVEDLRTLAADCRAAKQSLRGDVGASNNVPQSNVDSVGNTEAGEELTEHTPEARATISREMAQQKAEKEELEKANQPRIPGELEFEEDQKETLRKEKEREANGCIQQCNQGKWKFHFDEEKRPGYVLLDISIQRHMSTSLIDVDVHPTYISVVIKSKILRLRLPSEVKAEESTAKRSTTTGNLLVTMPKVDPDSNMIAFRGAAKVQAGAGEKSKKVRPSRAKGGLASQMLQDGIEKLTGTVEIDRIVGSDTERGADIKQRNVGLREVTSRKKSNPSAFRDGVVDEENAEDDTASSSDGPPPLF